MGSNFLEATEKIHRRWSIISKNKMEGIQCRVHYEAPLKIASQRDEIEKIVFSLSQNVKG